MGKRSNGFERAPRDYYPTPEAAVLPLIPHLPYGSMFIEPCAGDGRLVQHLEKHGMSCIWALDIEPSADWVEQGDALDTEFDQEPDADFIITNPPWDRKLLHPMIETFSRHFPTWLLYDADWLHTRQSAPFMPYCRKIVSVGRVKWIEDSKMTGKDNVAWINFDWNNPGPCEFIGR